MLLQPGTLLFTKVPVQVGLNVQVQLSDPSCTMGPRVFT